MGSVSYWMAKKRTETRKGWLRRKRKERRKKEGKGGEKRKTQRGEASNLLTEMLL